MSETVAAIDVFQVMCENVLRSIYTFFEISLYDTVLTHKIENGTISLVPNEIREIREQYKVWLTCAENLLKEVESFELFDIRGNYFSILKQCVENCKNLISLSVEDIILTYQDLKDGRYEPADFEGEK